MPDGEEIELKFEIDPAAFDRLEQRLTVRLGAVDPPPVQALRSVYYDTPDRRLQKAGFTLRVREADGRRVQTVKQEGGGLIGRGEWECDLGTDALDLDAAARTPLEPFLKDAIGRLGPLFSTRVDRTRCMIRSEDGEVEAALDRGAIEADGRTSVVCELELELKAGRPGVLFTVARSLAEGTPLRLSFDSKSQRGFRLLDDRLTDIALAKPPALEPGMSVSLALQSIGASCLRQWVANAAVLRAHRRPEALHQMRVALRRLRTGLKLFESAAKDRQLPRLMDGLKWVAAELDPARDLDVLIAETFAPALDRFPGQPGLGGLDERLRAARRRAYDRALAVLETERYLSLVLDLAGWLESGAWRDAADPEFCPEADAPIEGLAGKALDSLRRQVKRRGRILADLEPAARHQLRIRAKRLRYALEFFSDLYPDHATRQSRMLKALKAMQDALGQLNDMAAAQAQGLALAEGGGRAAGQSETAGAHEAFAAGLIIGARRRSERGLIKKAARHYADLMKAKPYWRA